MSPEPGHGVVVAGVDGSAASAGVLTWAKRQADLTGGRLRVVMAWRLPYPPLAPALYDAHSFSASAHAGLEHSLAGVFGPDFATIVDYKVVQGQAAQVLIDESRGADLLVIGSRGHGGFVGMMLGSVSQHVTAHAHCPVVVIREGADI